MCYTEVVLFKKGINMKNKLTLTLTFLLAVSITSAFACPPQTLVCGKNTIFNYPTDIPEGSYDNSGCNKNGIINIIQYGPPRTDMQNSYPFGVAEQISGTTWIIKLHGYNGTYKNCTMVKK